MKARIRRGLVVRKRALVGILGESSRAKLRFSGCYGMAATGSTNCGRTTLQTKLLRNPPAGGREAEGDCLKIWMCHDSGNRGGIEFQKPRADILGTR